jgi:hypothetical protein
MRGSEDDAGCLILFDAGATGHIPEGEMPAAGRVSRAVVQEAVPAGVWVFGADPAQDAMLHQCDLGI